jgi:gamma-glutamyl:cysteine ligase YbdK (ATP-grasp superfamily)
MPEAEADLDAAVREVLSTDRDAFVDRVETELVELKSAVRAGTFDNPQGMVGLEWELYGVDTETDALRRIPRPLLDLIGFEHELGLHNAEMGTNPQPLNRHGLAAQAAELRANLRAGLRATRMEGLTLVSDGLWTIPPNGETTAEYLCDCVDVDGVLIATNMSESPRYHAMSSSPYEAGMAFDLPHASLAADTLMPASLTTSIQPHYQVSHAPYIPEYHRYALRVAPPLLALAANSPFLPPDCYDDGVDPEAVLADSHHENRVFVFEETLNPPDGPGKVAFPPDVDTVEEAIDRIATDAVVVPGGVEASGRFDDRFKHFRHKHGTYWRWVRPVFDGATESTANARIEFRPIPAQPTVDDVVAFLATFAGLMESLPTWEHPVGDMDWERAKASFYAAARDGLDADLAWVTADGQATDDRAVIYEELFENAVEGLCRRDVPEREARRYVRPLRRRVEAGTTPAGWKREQVRRRLDNGADLTEAIHGAQRAYVDHQRRTLLEGSFADWLP